MGSSTHHHEEETVTAYDVVEAVIYVIVLALLTYGVSAVFGS